MERGDDVVKVGRTLIGMDEGHRERDFILDSISQWRLARAEVMWSQARRPTTN